MTEQSSIPAASKSSWASFLKSIASFSGDLSTLTAPSFILSGTSLLEYSAYWAEHPHLLAAVATGDAEQRMINVTKWYCATLKGQFSARHESVGGEKKPLNPILGEEFHGSWKNQEGETTLVAEQVSHHPPISAYRIKAPNGVTLQGHNGQKSGFSGRTIIVRQVGHAVLAVPQQTLTENYLITLPQLSLEGLFFGSPYAELTEKSYIIASSGWRTEFEYSGKGWLAGKKNTLKAKVYAPEAQKASWVVEGQWTDQMSIQRYQKHGHSSSSTGASDGIPFIITKDIPPQHITPSSAHAQNDHESRNLWRGVAEALKEGDYDAASRLKSIIEVKQRDIRKTEKEQGADWKRKFFKWEDKDPIVEQFGPKCGLFNEGRWQYVGQ